MALTRIQITVTTAKAAPYAAVSSATEGGMAYATTAIARQMISDVNADSCGERFSPPSMINITVSGAAAKIADSPSE
jgi:hypothetical protein